MFRFAPILILFAIAVTLGCSDDAPHGDVEADAGPARLEQPNNDEDGRMDAGSRDADRTQRRLDASFADGGSCTPGEVLGCSTEIAQRVCTDDGAGIAERDCAPGEYCLGGTCGDQRCIPESRSCADPAHMQICNADGTDWLEPEACPENTVCENGSCKSICDLGGKGPSYIGCEYWTLDLDQYHDPGTNPKPDEVPHAVVISNPGPADATLTFQPNAPGVSINIADPVVPVGQARAFTMPRLDVDGSGISSNVIQILSSSPVIAHQFNPLNNESVYSNDASLLLPASTHGTEYYVVNWPTQVIPDLPNLPSFPNQHSYVTIVATQPGRTNVTVTPTARITAGDQVPEMAPGTTMSFELSTGQVLNLQAADESAGLGQGENDLTGTHIVADRGIAVFAGHEEAVIGEAGQDSCCADHLEQQLFPLATWGSEYLAVQSPGRGQKKDHWRVVAGEDAVAITTTPAISGLDGQMLGAGESLAVFTDQSFEIQASGKISVAQFLVSQEQTSEVTGDPAFILSVPSNQFRTDYHLLTPQGYTRNYVTIVRPAGVEVRLDGAAVAGPFTAIGTGMWEQAAVEVAPGVHTLEASEPFGVQAYGFDNAVSYGYPGGLNLVGEDPQMP